MVFKPEHMNMFNNEGINIAWFDVGPRDGIPIMLIHGFASNAHVNWVFTGWVKTLTEAGYRVIAFDHRGHGMSDKPHDKKLYTPDHMAMDALSLLSMLGINAAHFMGYSMGARVSAFIAKKKPEYVKSLIFGGLGMAMVEGVRDSEGNKSGKGIDDWDNIAAALLAPSLDDVIHKRGRMFRSFSEQTNSDRYALAACIQTSRVLVSRVELSHMSMPTLIVVGTRDDIAGSGQELAALMPQATAIDVPERDHMLTVGDKIFKKAVPEFLMNF